jgi:pyruvate dehydrogenase E1 component beta subunit
MSAIETTYREALRQALTDAMRADGDIVILGEEVGRYGGAYGVTKGMLEEFGEERLIDTPISEAGFTGVAVGAAMSGLRPVCELMYIDFAGLVMDQLANQAAKIRYMFGGQASVPMVLRTQGGTGRSAAAQHSQSLEAWMMHIPGLRVAMPATVNDAYHLLRQALRRPDPVAFIEHKGLYARKGQLDTAAPDGAWGEAVTRRHGKDVTLITYSRMLHVVEAAAAELAAAGIDCEIIDLRTLDPLDEEKLVASVLRTGRAAVVTESVASAGVAADIAARLQELGFDYLEEPIIRITGEDIPIPVAPELEAASIPSAELVAETVRYLMRRGTPSWA